MTMTNKLDAEVQKMIVKQISTALKEMGLSTKGPKVELQSCFWELLKGHM
jgi:hypothetical protein